MHVSGVYNQSQYIKNSLLLLCCEYQLPPVIDASRTTPITRVNQGPMLLKLIGWRHCLCFKRVPCIPGTTAHTPALNQALPQGSQVTCITCITGTRIGLGCQSPYGNPGVESSFGCATYIKGPSKIQTLTYPSISSIPV